MKQLVILSGKGGTGKTTVAAALAHLASREYPIVLAGADLALHVVEPTISGVHDLQRILATTDHFGVPSLVVVNKADLNLARSEEIAAFCAERGVALAGHVPYDNVVAEAMVQGLPVTDYTDGPVTEALEEVWQRVRKRLLAG